MLKVKHSKFKSELHNSKLIISKKEYYKINSIIIVILMIIIIMKIKMEMEIIWQNSNHLL